MSTYIHFSISTNVNIHRYTTYTHECPQTCIHMKTSEQLSRCPSITGNLALGLSHTYALCSNSTAASWDQEWGSFLFSYWLLPVNWVNTVLQKNILCTTLLISHEAWNPIQQLWVKKDKKEVIFFQLNS